MESKISAKEKEILKFWQDNQIFEKTLKKDSPKGDYVFYDGPPFATGTPHYGHIIGSLMKDVVPRFWTMNGYHVARRWGWDCHGLPVENLIEKELKLDTKRDIEEKIGVCGFNEACQLSVLRYADVWQKFIPRIGRWVDMDDDYKTMDPKYMESIWWVFKTLYDKGLIYEGYKAMHICPRCETTLSNFEVTQGYKDVKDLSTTWKFKITENNGRLANIENTYLLAWTTVPWSTVSTMGLAVGPNYTYLKVKVGNEFFIFIKDRLEKVMAGKGDYEIVGEIKGSDLAGLGYEPVFGFYKEFPEIKNNKNVYHVFATDYVETTEGTGVVTINGAYGEVDLNSATKLGLPVLTDVGVDGKFKEIANGYAGMYVKKAEKKLVADMTEKGLVWSTEEYTHSYPHCWRCDTPLLNYATSSWFVKVTEIKKDLIKNNQKIHWTPSHLKEGRFGKWLEGATDWAISRQRYWGTPLPVWKCSCGQIKVAGSIADLEKLANQKVTDLHKHIVDEIRIKCDKCGKEMNRIPDVLDCWFESGSMPYAQVHYPFENKDWFEKNFPAEFIAEGIDQTRGWFYTLMVLSTALFNKPAFENVIVNGIVLAPDGQKMSKRLKNYPEPDLIVDQYGADALRYYMLTSPVVEAENFNFSEVGVKEALQKNIMLVGNILSFYLMYQKESLVTDRKKIKPKNILDDWILAKLNLLNLEITEKLKDYDLLRATRPIAGFINELSTWYLRRSRDRFKQGDQIGINTLGFVLLEFCKLIAPFMPFLAEDIYHQVGGPKESVHLADWPKLDKKSIDQNLVSEMDLVLQIVEKGLAARAAAGIKIRQPLASYSTAAAKKMDKQLIELVKDELNVKELIFDVADGLDTEITKELKLEGQARELIRQINQLRKDAGLTISDKVNITYDGLDEVFAKFGSEIKKSTLAENIQKAQTDNLKAVEGGKIGINKI
ncbi:MAG: isoleucine--tRNA ligase [Candidatus Buchananbacteria bacterium]